MTPLNTVPLKRNHSVIERYHRSVQTKLHGKIEGVWVPSHHTRFMVLFNENQLPSLVSHFPRWEWVGSSTEECYVVCSKNYVNKLKKGRCMCLQAIFHHTLFALLQPPWLKLCSVWINRGLCKIMSHMLGHIIWLLQCSEITWPKDLCGWNNVAAIIPHYNVGAGPDPQGGDVITKIVTLVPKMLNSAHRKKLNRIITSSEQIGRDMGVLAQNVADFP